MRRHSVPLAIAAALTAATLGATTASAAPAAPIKYLALGDSYPAGVGVTSSQAYPALLAQQTPRTVLENNAASGATTTLVQGQITTGHDVVTLTVGANDLNWTSVLTGCLATGPCTPPTPTEVATMGAGVATDIVVAHEANPGAAIYVTGYPLPFDTAAALSGTCTIGPNPFAPSVPVTVGSTQAAGVNAMVTGMNAAIQGAVTTTAAAEIDVTYVDASAQFDGHRLCDDTPWLYDLTTLPIAFHPTADGQQAYAKAIAKSGFRALATQPIAAGRS